MTGKLICTFDRIGRRRDVEPFVFEYATLDAATQDRFVEALLKYASGRLGSSDVEVHVNLEEGRGIVLAGVQTAGRFTVVNEPTEGPAEWYARTGHCAACGQPGGFCLCRKACGCAHLHEVGSGLVADAVDQFSDAPAALVDADQGELFG